MSNDLSVKTCKCLSCGASVLEEEKKCSYCGSANPNYNKKQIKETKPNFTIDSPEDDIGGFLGGVILSGLMRGVRNFHSRKRR